MALLVLVLVLVVLRRALAPPRRLLGRGGGNIKRIAYVEAATALMHTTPRVGGLHTECVALMHAGGPTLQPPRPPAGTSTGIWAARQGRRNLLLLPPPSLCRRCL